MNFIFYRLSSSRIILEPNNFAIERKQEIKLIMPVMNFKFRNIN